MAAQTPNPQQPDNPIISLLKNLLQLFPQPKKQEPAADVVAADDEAKAIVVFEERENGSQKPEVVNFWDGRPIVVHPLKLEAKEAEKNTNPRVLWQVYVLGGIVILRWVWARWRERSAKNEASEEASDEEISPDDEY